MTNLQRWFLILALWAVILFAGFAFYWSTVRPGQIRRSCAQKARQICAETKSGFSSMLEINRAVYLDCLKSHGLDR